MDSYLLTLKRRRPLQGPRPHLLQSPAPPSSGEDQDPRMTVKEAYVDSCPGQGLLSRVGAVRGSRPKVEKTGNMVTWFLRSSLCSPEATAQHPALARRRGRATVDTKLTWRSLRTDGTGSTWSSSKQVRNDPVHRRPPPVGGGGTTSRSQAGTTMAPCDTRTWHRTLRRYFPEYVRRPLNTREAPLAMAA